MIVRILFRSIRVFVFFITSFFYLRVTHNYKGFAKSIESMGATFIKLAQSFSTRQDIVGVELADMLLRLCDSVKAFKYKYFQSIVEKEFAKNVEALFLELDKIPVASASISQVYKAVTYDGHSVAIKVLRPKIEEEILIDLRIIKLVSFLLSPFINKKLRLSEAVRRFSESTKFELDLLIEASNIAEMQENFKNDPYIKIPKVLWEYSRHNILVTEWIDGINFSKLQSLDKNLLNKIICMLFKQVYEFGFFHGDLHPGNIMVTKDNKIGVVDFGITGRISDVDKSYIAHIAKGFMTQDYQLIADVHYAAGYINKNKSFFVSACRAIGSQIANQPVREIRVASLVSRLFKTVADFGIEVQPQLLLLQKNIMLLEGSCKKLNPDVNMWLPIKPHIYKWLSAEYGIKGKVKKVKQILEQLSAILHNLNQSLQNGFMITQSRTYNNKK